MANNCYTGLKECDTPKGREVVEFDSKYCPPNADPSRSFSCVQDCIDEDYCSDIQEGFYEFEGSATVFGVCNLSKSYLIVKVDGDCEVAWGAVFEHGKVLIDTTGTYRVKYKWDNCCELEPVFGHEDGCPCP